MTAYPIIFAMLTIAQTAEGPKGDSPKASAASETSLAAMFQRVEKTQVTIPKNSAAKIKVEAAPVFRYSDELRRIEDAGMRLWTDRGRPVAAMKVERYTPGIHPEPWLYCFASLSSDQVAAEWKGARGYQTRKPGVTWKVLDDAPKENRAGRLVQMRDLARRFGAELIDYKDVSSQMRLLSRPLFRYDDGPTDGAVFGFTGTGTNPDFLLLLETRPDNKWQFGCVTMTADGLRIRLKDEVVFTAPHVGGKGNEFDNWLHFWTK